MGHPILGIFSSSIPLFPKFIPSNPALMAVNKSVPFTSVILERKNMGKNMRNWQESGKGREEASSKFGFGAPEERHWKM
jgi:uncharacterized membrane protein YbaN (DUF454 family)